MKVIAFGHKRRVGKNKACELLNSYLRTKGSSLQIQTASFAYSLKKTCDDLFNTGTPEYYETYPKHKEDVLKHLDKSPREVWIEFGNYARSIDSLVWIRKVFKDYKNTDILLISDLRYPNEAKYIKSIGGYNILLDRDVPKTDDVADTALDGWNGWDLKLDNNSDLKALYKLLIETVVPLCLEDK
jgi:hypothetical protein